MRNGDLRSQVIEPNYDRQKILEERFGDRLILRQHWGEKPNITDRIVKNVKQNQLDPSTNEKWSHGMYQGNPERQNAAQRAPSVPVVEEVLDESKHKAPHQNKVLVRNLPTDINKSQVESIFNRYGKVTKAQVEEGFAIVSFTDNEGALQAHYITNHKKLLKINGNTIKVSLIEDDSL
jgi:RNA recognition motif-containing protein